LTIIYSGVWASSKLVYTMMCLSIQEIIL